MCLIAFALDAHPAHRLVLMANRDEAYARPASPLGPWPDAPGVLAGRDLMAGGTWLGVSETGRWAALTNVRDPLHPRMAVQSRGALVSDYLRSDDSAAGYADAVRGQRDAFDGFNVVVGDREGVFVVSTRHDDVLELGPGVYGLSNDRLDTPWPKVVRSRRRLRDAIRAGTLAPDDLLAWLDDREGAPDADLPDTGVGLDLERVLAPVRIVTDGYGTRVSTALILNHDQTGTITERTWHPDGTAGATETERIGG
ncbi:NRDE family protein [Rubrivirga sp. IMCC43871]|uniref:NRDE family protein n=1 Tax=Rubrivirga sp. IMCC43871 TaxID=3391575 RepID=UPI00398FDC79